MLFKRRKKKGERMNRESVERDTSSDKVKIAHPISNNFIRQILRNPDLSYQVVIILLTLLNGNTRLDRRIDTITTTIDKMRNITEVLNTTMNSLKSASEAPRQIMRLLE